MRSVCIIKETRTLRERSVSAFEPGRLKYEEENIEGILLSTNGFDALRVTDLQYTIVIQ